MYGNAAGAKRGKRYIEICGARRCPMSIRNELSTLMLMWYSHAKDGQFPCVGKLLDQPTRFVQAMGIIGRIEREYEKYKADQERRRDGT